MGHFGTKVNREYVKYYWYISIAYNVNRTHWSKSQLSFDMATVARVLFVKSPP